MANRVLQFILEAKDGASAVFKKVEDAAGGFSLKLGSLAKAAAALAASAALGKFFKDSIEEAAEAERGMARLGTAVTNAGGDFKQLAPVLEDTIGSVRRLSTFTDDDLRAALTNMVTLTGDVAGSTENLSLVADLAAARNMDLAAASDVVAKAMNGNTTALNKLGIAGKDSETVMENLRKSVGGFAATDAKTFDGALKNLNNSWKDFQENVGAAILGTGQASGAAGKLSGMLADLAGWVQENEAAIGKFVDVLFRLGDVVVKVLVGAFKLLRPVIDLAIKGLGLLLEAIGWLVEKGGWLLNKLGINVDVGLGASLKAAGKSLQDFTREVEKSEEKHTATVTAGTKKRVRLTQAQYDEQAKQQKKANEEAKRLAEKHAAEIEKIVTQQFVSLTANVKDTTGAMNGLSQATQRFIDKAVALAGPSGPIEKLKNAPTTFPTSKALERMADEADEADEQTRKFSDALQDGISYATTFASGLGLISDSAAQAIQAIANLGQGIAKVAGGDLSGIAGIISGAVGLLGKLFGEDPKEAARKALVEANTEAIKRLSGKITDIMGINQTGTQIEKILQLGASVFSREAGKKSRLAAGLAESGLRIEDIEDLGKAFGISVVSSEGRFEFDAFRQLMGVLGSAQIGTPQTFAGILAQAEQGKSIGALDEAAFQGRLVDALAVGGGNAILDALQGADFTTQEGQDAAVEQLRALFLDISGTPRTAEELAPLLGGLTSTEFFGAIEQLIGLIGGDADLTGLGAALAADVAPATVDLGADINEVADVGREQITVLEAIRVELSGIRENTSRPVATAPRGTGLRTVNEQLYEELYDAQLSQGIIERG